MLHSRLAVLLLLVISLPVLGTAPDQKKLPIGFAPWEHVSKDAREEAPLTAPPKGHIRSLSEWETAESAMTLWPNPSLVSALAAHGSVKLIADESKDVSWWKNWLGENHISQDKVSYFTTPTNSVWIRDYGPWFILDGEANFGVVHAKYNRPRPLDDLVAGYIARQLGIPFYQPGLVHTGGNYYADGLGNAFSSTLVYSENSELSAGQVNQRMHDFLGIDRYTTSPLAPEITIEHLDTFGKLVSPDTWVFSEFPEGTPYKADSDRMVALLKTLKSPYGTPYKIYRMKMIPTDDDGYRPYINSFISNHALYFPAYGDDAIDQAAKAVYQKALPGYDIVEVDVEDTTWGDSVHCRTRNLLTRNTVFIFPTVTEETTRGVAVEAEVIASPGNTIVASPQIHWKANGVAQADLAMTRDHDRYYEAKLPPEPVGTAVSLYIEASDSAGIHKTAPIYAPEMSIDLTIQ